MSIEPIAFLDTAREELNGAVSEVCLRNIGSRAYYSLYHLGLSKAGELGLPPSENISSGVHQRLSDRFHSHSYRGKQFAIALNRLKKKRVTCDYYIHDDISKDEIEQLVASVDEAIRKLNRVE